jgi:hypothetical protein
MHGGKIAITALEICSPALALQQACAELESVAQTGALPENAAAVSTRLAALAQATREALATWQTPPCP